MRTIVNQLGNDTALNAIIEDEAGKTWNVTAEFPRGEKDGDRFIIRENRMQGADNGFLAVPSEKETDIVKVGTKTGDGDDIHANDAKDFNKVLSPFVINAMRDWAQRAKTRVSNKSGSIKKN